MNVFRTDNDPEAAALDLADRHVVKMVLESAQILSTVARESLPEDLLPPDLYRPTHKAHPVVALVTRDGDALRWLAAHAIALCWEYRDRYGKDHKSESVIWSAIGVLGLEGARWSASAPAVFCGEDHGGDTVPEKYRAYLRAKYAGWSRPPKWSGSAGVPAWMG